jgi:hypothetical protein
VPKRQPTITAIHVRGHHRITVIHQDQVTILYLTAGSHEDDDRRTQPEQGASSVTDDSSRAAWMSQLPPMDLFGALLFQVAGQQLSVAATQRTWRASGPSWRGISRHPPNCWAWSLISSARPGSRGGSSLPDVELMAELTAIPGIGPWTMQEPRRRLLCRAPRTPITAGHEYRLRGACP